MHIKPNPNIIQNQTYLGGEIYVEDGHNQGQGIAVGDRVGPAFAT